MTNKDKLIEIFAIAYMDRADPDGGFDYAKKFSESIVQHYDTAEVKTWLNDIEIGYAVEYLPDFGDFEVV